MAAVRTHRLFGGLFLEEPAKNLSQSQLNSSQQLRPFIDELERLRRELFIHNAFHG